MEVIEDGYSFGYQALKKRQLNVDKSYITETVCEMMVVSKGLFSRIAAKYDIKKQQKRQFLLDAFCDFQETKNMKILNELMELT